MTEESKLRLDSILVWLTNLALVLIALSFPFDPRYSLLSLILLAATGVARLLFLTRRFTPPDKILVCFVIMYLVRLLWFFRGEVDTPYRMKTIENESAMALIPIIFILIKLTPLSRSLALKAFSAMAALTIVFAFIRLATKVMHSTQTVREYFKVYFENAKFHSSGEMLDWKFAHYSFLSLMVIYALHFLFFMKLVSSKLKYSLFVGYLLLATAFILVTGSKIGLILLLLSPLSYVLILSRVFRNWYIRAGAIVFAISVLLYVGKYHYRQYDPKRYDMIVIALKAIAKEPLLGYGAGSRKNLMHDETFEYNYTGTVNHPHNEFLSEIMEYGIVGTIPLFLLLFYCFRDAAIKDNKELLAVTISMVVFMLIETPFGSNKGLLPFVFIVSLLVTSQDANKPQIVGSKKIE